MRKAFGILDERCVYVYVCGNQTKNVYENSKTIKTVWLLLIIKPLLAITITALSFYSRMRLSRPNAKRYCFVDNAVPLIYSKS